MSTETQTDQPLVLHLFRMVGDVKQPVRFHVNKDRVIIKEEYPAVQPPTEKNLTPQQEALAHVGVEFSTDALGRTVVTHVPKDVQDAFAFFDLTTPCWFEGCQSLRDLYTAELEEAGGAECPACVKGDLTRKYLPKVRAAISNQRVS